MIDVALHVYVAFPAQAGSAYWWSDGTVVEAVLAAMDAAGLWLGWSWVGLERGERFVQVASRAALVEHLRGREPGSWELRAQRKRGADDPQVVLWLSGELRVEWLFPPAFVATRPGVLFDQLVDFVARIAEALGERAQIADRTRAWSLDLEAPRPRPPRQHPVLEHGSLLDVVDPACHQGGDGPAFVRQIADAELPAGVRRERRGRLIFLRWLTGVPDADHAARAATAQERWIARTFHPPIAPGWNEAGDQQVTPAALAAHPPLTFYDGLAGIGYQTILASPDGELDDDARERLDQLAGWIRGGALPDGTRLETVRLIAPTRDAAFALFERAEAAGCDAVLYPDDQGRFWDPVPAGDWLDPEPP